MINALFISTDWNDGGRDGKYGGVTEYRLKLPAEELRKKGHTVTLKGKDLGDEIYQGKQPKSAKEMKEMWRDYIIQFDVVVSKVIDNPIAAGLLIETCKITKTPLVVDLDDNFLAVTPDQPAYLKGYGEGGEARGYAMAFVSMADAIFCSTQPLADYFKEYIFKKWGEFPTTYVLPNSVRDDWPKQKKTEKSIGWAGSITHKDDIRMALPGIIDAFRELPEEYRMSFLGGFTKKDFQKEFNTPSWFIKRCDFHPGTSGYEGYKELLAKQEWGLALAPIVDNDFNRSRSNIKWIEYTMVGIPTVASLVYPYQQSITHSTDGWLCKEEEWKDTILTAIEASEGMVDEAKKTVLEKYNIEKNVQLWEDAINAVV